MNCKLSFDHLLDMCKHRRSWTWRGTKSVLFSEWNHTFQSLCSQSKMCRLGDTITSLHDPPIHNPKGRPSTTRLSGPSEGPAQPVNRRVECKHLPPVRTQLFNTSPTALVDYIMNEYSCHPPPNRTSDRVNRVLT